MKLTESAGGVVVNKDGLIMIVSQKGNSWSLPKGHIEAGEDKLSAALREIKEESGIDRLELIKSLGSYKRYKISKDGKSIDKSELKTIHIFLFKTNQNDLKPIDKDNPEARWVKKEQAIELLTRIEDKEFLKSVKEIN
jgi:ADP-ribose pyrophosphatase YjhB (NUDIX family)